MDKECTMKKIMTIWEHIRIDGKGLVVGGTNPDFLNTEVDEIYKIIKTFVFIKKKDGDVNKYEVFDVNITTSIRDNKNIFLLLHENTEIYEVEKGSEVYCCDCDSSDSPN